MENVTRNKRYLLVLGPMLLLIILAGLTYALFNYTKTGTSNVLKVGRISFVSKNEQTVNLTNAFPIDPTNSSEMNDSTKVGTYYIEIKGDTDYADGVEYLVSAVDTNIRTSTGKTVPISLNMTVSSGLGTSNANYFTARESKNASIYKNLIGDTLLGDQMLLVGYIKPNTTRGIAEGVDGSITIKTYLDENKILISDTYNNGAAPTATHGTPVSLGEGKTVFTTTEWLALKNSGMSFKIKVEANEGIWVTGSLEEIMRTKAVMDNTTSTYVTGVSGIDFGAVSSNTNGKGVYMRAGTQNDDYPIMYYRGEVDDNNVYFANKCWKGVRTTETGGVKLIYNGLPHDVYAIEPIAENRYTKNTSNTDSRWTFNSSDNTWNIVINDNTSPQIEFTVTAGNNYTLDLTGTSGTDCGGTYSFYKNGTKEKSYGNGGGAAMDLSHFFGTLASTDIIKMDFVGSSSSTCPITFKLKMIGEGNKISDNGCYNTNTDTLISLEENNTEQNTFSFNTNNYSPVHNGYMNGWLYYMGVDGWTTGARFGSGFTWDGTNYTLVDDTVTSPNSTHHYSCNSTTENDTCSTIRYVYYVNNDTKYYISLTNGIDIDEAIARMNTNINSSNVKSKIDIWYASNMVAYTDYLEDTIWCNDRSIAKYNGWTANGSWSNSNYKEYSILYGAHERSNGASNSSTTQNQPSLTCTNKDDRFTVHNPNGNSKLTYPVAMLTADEIVLAGGVAGAESSFYLYNDSAAYWTLSPIFFDDYHAFQVQLDSAGKMIESLVTYPLGIRPAISLKPGIAITSGDGTSTNPYKIG